MGNKDKQQQNISSGISQIALKNVATFDENGASFENLNSINFIYGANGSGKTTTSSFLKNLAENGIEDKFANSKIEWCNGENLQIEVYNKQFKEEQFRNSQVKGIFTLGKKTNENLEKLESKQESMNEEKEKKKKNEESWQKLKQEREKKEKDFTDSCWEKLYKKNEKDFKEILEGFKRKEKFKEKILKEFENDKHNKSKIVILEELKEKIGIVFSENQTELVSLECNLTDFDSIENHSIWEQKVVGSGDVAIADLIKKLSNEDWVACGREYIKDNSICPFCQKETITEEFKKQLELYFDTSYQESTDTIKKMKEDYTNKTAEVLERLDEIVETEQKNQQTKLNTESFKRIVGTLKSKINGNQQKMHDKSKEMSRSFELESTKNEIKEIRDLIDTANQQIANHNKIIKDTKNQKKNYVEQTWKFLVNEFKSDIQEYNKKYCGLKKGIENLEKEIRENREKIKRLGNEIRELEKNMVSIKPIVNEINTLLKEYGFTNFGFACTEDEKSYRIQREDGQLVGETLSEGEVTFITFLYYYHLTKGSLKENDISKNKVLVIDDPISSLDSNILFIVSVLVKDLIKETMEEKTNIKQVIILTHNTYFYKEITLEYDLKRYQGKYSFWIIKKDNNISKIKNYKENPIKSSYELLWQEVKQAKENNISWVSLQNVMRRIIEYYFRILGGFKHNDSLSECFENIEEKQVCNSFISWFNDGSHGISDDLFVQSQDTSIETYLKVFEKIFEITGHEAHYKMMMGIKMRIVFMGTPGFAEVILRALVENEEKKIEVVGLFTQMDKPFGRKKELKAPETKTYILENHLNIPIFQPQSLKEPEVQILKDLKPDFIVVVAYGKILPKEVLTIAPCINLHASLLPKYRGASPIHEMILNDDKIYGISTMLMDVGLDSGDILESASFLREDYLDLDALSLKLAHMGAALLLSTLKNFFSITRKPQDHAQASFCKKITKADGLVGFKDAKSLFLKSLAFKSWPEIFLENSLKLLEVELVENEKSHKEGEILEIDEKGVLVGCLKGSVRIARLQAVGKKPLKAKDYLNGKRLKIGGILA